MASEPEFVPRDDQVDYTNIRYCPVISCAVTCGDSILLLKRNPKMRLYPNYWSGIAGFLDDHKSVEEKVREELQEELGFGPAAIMSIKRGSIDIEEAPDYGKTWIRFLVLVEVNTKTVKLDWEAADHRWLKPAEAMKLKLLPGYERVLAEFFPNEMKL